MLSPAPSRSRLSRPPRLAHACTHSAPRSILMYCSIGEGYIKVFHVFDVFGEYISFKLYLQTEKKKKEEKIKVTRFIYVKGQFFFEEEIGSMLHIDAEG